MHKCEIDLDMTIEDQALDEAMRELFPSLTLEDLDGKQADLALARRDELLGR